MILSLLLAATLSIQGVVPQPVYAADPSLVELYYKAWELAAEHIRNEDGLASPRYMDEGCMDGDGPGTIWIWDTAFMSLFCKYAPAYFPGVESLRNFYEPILDGRDSPLRIHHPDNPPLFAWVEYDNYQFTADKAHLDSLLLVNKYLQRWYDYFNALKPGLEFSFGHQPIAIKKHEKGFEWAGNQSGMDNTPRDRDGVIYWVDAISQQALSALYISRIAEICSDGKTAAKFKKEYQRLKRLINKYYWDDVDGCYYDIRIKDLKPTGILTPASFWPMMAEIPDTAQAVRMAEYALAPQRLGGTSPWKSLSAEDPDFFADGGKYWQGAIWLPTAYMGIKALEKYGMRDRANQTAEQLLSQMNRTYRDYDPHSIWECYSPTADKPANGKKKPVVREDFCGWSALGPISLFIENVIGIYEIDASRRIVRWDIHHEFEHGIRNLRFGDTITDLVYRNGVILVSSNAPYTLCAGGRSFSVKAGDSVLSLSTETFDYKGHLKTMYAHSEKRFAFEKLQATSLEQWQEEFRAALWAQLGLDVVEKACAGFKPSARQIDCEDLGWCTRERWEIYTEPDVLLPFIIMRPKGIEGKKVPLMITPHGHGKNTESYAGIYQNEEQRFKAEQGERNIAVQAAQHGFIAIAPTARGFGKTRDERDLFEDNLSSCKDLMLRDALVGRTPVGDRVWDIMKLIDWALENLPVDDSNIIVSGNSGGGTASFYAGAIDTRISQTLPGSAFCDYESSIGLIDHCACNYVPGIMQLGDMGDIAGLIAPRAFCAIHGVKDEIFPIEGTRAAFATARKAFEAAGVPNNCALYEGPEGHRYYKAGAWDFILSHLNEQSLIRRVIPMTGLPKDGANALCIDGNILYCGAGNKIYAVDVSEPLSPRPLSNVEIYGKVRQMTVKDGVLYAACRESGAWTIDVSDPSAISIITRFDTVELATGVEVAGNVLFLATRQNGVECVDVSDPAHPVHIRMEKTPESQSVTYRDGYLYSGEWGAHCISVIDARDMSKLKTIGAVNLQGYGDGLWTWGKYLYAATGHHSSSPDLPAEERKGRGHGLEIFDISDPERPSFVSRVSFDTFYKVSNDYWTPRPCSDGAYVVVADTFNGIYVVNTRQPAEPEIIARRQFQDEKVQEAAVTSLAIGNGAVYVSVASGCGFYMLECPDIFPCVTDKGKAPENIAYRYPYETSASSHFLAWKPGEVSPVRGLAAHGNVLYVAHSYGGLSILRKGCKGPKLIGKGPMKYAGDVKVTGDILWVAEGFDGLAAYKIGREAKLTFIARYNDFMEHGPNAACQWVFVPGDGVVAANLRLGNYYLDVSHLPEIRFKSFFSGGAGWDKFYSDKADSKGWYPATRHKQGLFWVNINDDPMKRIKDDGLIPSLTDGVCSYKEDQFISSAGGKITVFSSGQIGQKKSGAGEGFKGMPVWDGDARLGLTYRMKKQISLVDISDVETPKLLWREETSGYPETGTFWCGKFVVPCGYQGLLIEK